MYFTRPRPPASDADRIGGLDETLAAEIEQARLSVDLAFFDFDLPRVASALVAARGRGVAVRAVIDAQNLGAPPTALAAGALQRAGIPITFDRRPAFMHNKFVVVDRRVVWTGSWNATVRDTYDNDNNLLRLADERVAANYLIKFELLFRGKGGPGNPARLRSPDVALDGSSVTTAFAPDTDVTGMIVRILGHARRSANFLAFTVTSPAIAKALIEARARNVAIRGVVEARNAHGVGSAVPALKRAGLDVREDGNCGLMHDKVLIVDGRTVVTGSFNWSRQAQEVNDENVVLAESPWLAGRFTDEFERIYRQAATPMRCGS